MSMNDDLAQYPVFLVYNKEIMPADYIKTTNDYNHYVYEANHFVRQSVRKNSLDFYKRVEHLQKMIIMPKEMNKDLETMGADGFFKKWGMNKDDLVFSRLKWREGYYD